MTACPPPGPARQLSAVPPPRPALLLPPRLEAARCAVPVADPLTVKGCPGYAPKAQPLRLSEVSLIWRRTGVLAHVGTGPDESYMLLDKRHPHAQHEIMMMSAGTHLRPGLHDHSPAFAAALGAMTACFAGHCRTAGLYPVLSWSYDPATIDRESIQGEKRFHAHLLGRTEHELALAAGLALPAGAYPSRRRRRTVDEACVLGAMLAGDCLATVRLHALQLIEPLSTPQATACLQLRVPRGWQSFTGAALFADLRTLHRVLRRIYDVIAHACLTGAVGTWQRPEVDASQAGRIPLPLSPASRDALAHYLTALQPSLLADTGFYADPRNRDRTTHVYPLADLAYSVCFSEHHGELFAHIRLNVFSDLGGAGVSVINGTVVKVRKGAGTYDEEELAARAAFQRSFLTGLRRHPDLGAAALYPLL
ncbi:MAG TPA: hypothetical protein VMV92_02440 [Streptosporangiaceae bacterium]|nr:hypothetical protein [Streptosporangiaceae bacterium]